MKKDFKKIKRQYEDACNEYVLAFCEKQDLYFEGWVGDTIGEIAICNDFYFNMSDIKLDIDTAQPIGNIIHWYYDNLESNNYINYCSYTKGLKIKDIKNEI